MLGFKRIWDFTSSRGGRYMSHAVLALGGNVGNVAEAFEQGLQRLERNGVKVGTFPLAKV